MAHVASWSTGTTGLLKAEERKANQQAGESALGTLETNQADTSERQFEPMSGPEGAGRECRCWVAYGGYWANALSQYGPGLAPDYRSST